MSTRDSTPYPFFADLKDFARTSVREFEPVAIEKWMSKWIVVSGLHKSVRRGRVEKALQMADLLLRLDPAYFWHRLPVIALEDVGHGDPWLIARIGWVCGQSRCRAEIGDRELALRAVERLAHVRLEPDVPFGGQKQSGIGREMGIWGLEEFCDLQVLSVKQK